MAHARKDFATLRDSMTVGEALDFIREKGIGERIVYFYVVDEAERLVGVLPTRRLLASPLSDPLSSIMIKGVIAIPERATLLEACEFFVLHKFFAFPVVDKQRHVIGLVDIGLFSEEVLDATERTQMNDVFEAIGFRVSQLKDASPWRAFRLRFPWLLATIGSGTVCALLAGAYEATLAQSLIIAFFLTLVLGLGESVSIQSMTVTIQTLRATAPTLRWYGGALRRELSTSLMLGLACGGVVAAIVCLWRGVGMPAAVIGSSILASLMAACVLGLSIPSLLHALKLDPKIAAGPITLAATDIMTLLFYFNIGTMLLVKA